MQRKLPSKHGFVCLGVIAGAHGIRGEVKVKSYTENPKDIARYGPVILKDDRSLTFVQVRETAKGLIIKFKEVPDRNMAETLKSEGLFVPREALPDEGDGEYFDDLLNMPVAYYENKVKIGIVLGVFDTQAHSVIEVKLDTGKIILLPFTDDVVEEVTDTVFLTSWAKQFEDI